MSKTGAIRAGRAFVELFADSTAMQRGLKVAQKQFQAFRGFASKMTFGIGGEVSKMLAGLAPAGILTTLGLFSKQFQEMGAELLKVSQQTGMSTEALSSLGYAAEQSGAKLGDVTSGLGNMQGMLLKAIQGNDEAINTFHQLGLSVGALARMNPEEQFLATAQALSRVTKGTLQATMANKLYGSAGTALLPMLAEGAAGIQKMQREAESLGLVMSLADAQLAADQLSAWTRAWKAAGAVGTKVGAALAPLLIKLFDIVASGISVVTKWIDQNRGMVRIIAVIVAVAAAATGILFGLAMAVALVGAVVTALTSIVGAAAAAFGILSGIIMAIVGSPLAIVLAAGAAGLGLLAYWAYQSGAAMDWLRSTFGPIYEIAITTFNAIKNAIASNSWAAAANVLWTTLKLAWISGTKGLYDTWIKFKGAAAGVMIDLSAELSKIWTETIGFLADAWSTFITGFRKSWIDLQTMLSNVIIRMSHSKEKAAEIIDNNNQKSEQDKNALDAGRDAAITAREQQRKDRIAGISSDQAAAKSENSQSVSAQLQASQTALTDAQAAWKEAIDEANALKPSGRTNDLKMNFAGIAAGLFNTQQQSSGHSGTFSAAAGRMYPGSGNTMQRLAERNLAELQGIRRGIDGINEVGR